MTEPVAKDALATAAFLRSLAALIAAYGFPTPTDELTPRSQSVLAPLDMPTVHPALSKRAQIAKVDEDRQLVFGWASVVTTEKGDLVEDSQHDRIEPHELEQAVYEFLPRFGQQGTGELHKGDPVGHVVESMVFTPEKTLAMGLPDMPVGWWIGVKVTDPEVFAKVKSGDYRMFSVQGRAVREPANE